MKPSKSIRKAERQYAQLFSTEALSLGGARYSDERIPDMFAHNFFRVTAEEPDGLMLHQEQQYRKDHGQKMLRIESFGDHQAAWDRITGSRSSKLQLFMIKPVCAPKSRVRPTECIIAETAADLRTGEGIDREAFGRDYADFASRRFARKLPLYLDREISLYHVICFDEQTPVGNCDIFIDGTLMKIEDVDVLEPYQRRGFASRMLSYIEVYAYENQIDTLFLQVEQDNEPARGLYRKLGYSCAGKNTILELPVD